MGITPQFAARTMGYTDHSFRGGRPYGMPPAIHDDLITSRANDAEHENLLSNDMLRWKYASLERMIHDVNNKQERLQKYFWRHHLVSDVAMHDMRPSDASSMTESSSESEEEKSDKEPDDPDNVKSPKKRKTETTMFFGGDWLSMNVRNR
eukprot:UN05843